MNLKNYQNIKIYKNRQIVAIKNINNSDSCWCIRINEKGDCKTS